MSAPGDGYTDSTHSGKLWSTLLATGSEDDEHAASTNARTLRTITVSVAGAFLWCLFVNLITVRIYPLMLSGNGHFRVPGCSRAGFGDHLITEVIESSLLA